MSNDRRRIIRSPSLSTYLFAEIEDLFIHYAALGAGAEEENRTFDHT